MIPRERQCGVAALPALGRSAKKMYREQFEAASQFLRSKGMHPHFESRSPVTEDDILELNKVTDLPMPTQLKDFYLEMGDGFYFRPDSADDSSLEGWEGNLLSDYRIHNQGFWTAIEEELQNELSRDLPRNEPVLLKEQADCRKVWVPFYGFVGSGDLLCLNAQGRVMFYQALDWVADPDLCQGFEVADSFESFVNQWSKFSFISPDQGWTSFSWNRSGQFDWDASHFPQVGRQ